ncbi:MAG: hypothetical protein ABSA21_08495 [Candidatus Limnocylindrales bacterium]
MDDLPVEGPPDDGAVSQEQVAADALPPRRPDPRPSAPVDPLTGEPPADLVPASRSRLRTGPSSRWRDVALALGLLLAILVGATGSLLLGAMNRGTGSHAVAASPSARATTGGPPSPTQSPAPIESPTPTGSVSPTPISTSGGASAAADTATPPPQTTGVASTATLTFHDLMLDSATDAGGTARTFTFTTDGPGSVSAQVVTAAPLATSKMCIQVNGSAKTCATGATPGFFTVAPQGDHAQWTVTLIATDPGSTPVVDVAFSWQTRAPAITLSHGRFQGAPNPDSLRGATATFKTRAAGTVAVSAAWPPALVDATLTLSDVTSLPGSTVDQVGYTAATSIDPAYSHVVKAGKTYQVQLQNSGTDSGRPDLAVTIAFP